MSYDDNNAHLGATKKTNSSNRTGNKALPLNKVQTEITFLNYSVPQENRNADYMQYFDEKQKIRWDAIS